MKYCLLQQRRRKGFAIILQYRRKKLLMRQRLFEWKNISNVLNLRFFQLQNSISYGYKIFKFQTTSINLNILKTLRQHFHLFTNLVSISFLLRLNVNFPCKMFSDCYAPCPFNLSISSRSENRS